LGIISERTVKGGYMPIFKKGEMFHASGYLIVTTNSFLTSEVKLVMGRGAAWILKMKVPGIDRVFGKMISETCGHLGRYGLLFHQRYGALQVKYRFDEKARVDLIEFSLEKLAEKADEFPKSRFNINYPGIGNGGLSKEEVGPLLNFLPDNVYVWEREEVLTWPIHQSSVASPPAR
jgi:hypothetical protein